MLASPAGSGPLLGIIAALLIIAIALLVDKVEDVGHLVESHSNQPQIGN